MGESESFDGVVGGERGAVVAGPRWTASGDEIVRPASPLEMGQFEGAASRMREKTRLAGSEPGAGWNGQGRRLRRRDDDTQHEKDVASCAGDHEEVEDFVGGETHPE